MNADRIVVVTGGEIVESGSHEELIRADGKYAELWSKQIFVKPKDKEPHDDKPAAKAKGRKAPGMSNIVNDLTAEATSSELAKVKSTPTTNGQAETEIQTSGQAETEIQTDGQAETEIQTNGQAVTKVQTDGQAEDSDSTKDKDTPATPGHKKEV